MKVRLLNILFIGSCLYLLFAGVQYLFAETAFERLMGAMLISSSSMNLLSQFSKKMRDFHRLFYTIFLISPAAFVLTLIFNKLI